MKKIRNSRGWFVFLQYIGLPLLILMTLVSQPVWLNEQSSILLSIGILLTWSIVSLALAEVNYRQAISAKRQQEQLIADISHDLRTPTSAMQTLLEIAQIDPKLTDDRPAQDVISRALVQVDVITSLINRLLQLSRLEYTSAPRLKPTSLRDLVVMAYTQLEPAIQRKQQTVTIAINAEINVYALADELVQLLVILLDNASKFSPAGSAIRIAAVEQRFRVVVSVIDNGVGLTAYEKKHIFDRFYQADYARRKTDTNQGFGLGLAIAAVIARRHKSVITVKSTAGSGSVFTIRLKRA